LREDPPRRSCVEHYPSWGSEIFGWKGDPLEADNFGDLSLHNKGSIKEKK
jgi:hypothetical protein